MGAGRYTRGTLLRELALIAAAAFYCLPFFMLVAIALETTEQAYKSPLSLHWPPHWGNFSEAWNTGGQAGSAPGCGAASSSRSRASSP